MALIQHGSCPYEKRRLGHRHIEGRPCKVTGEDAAGKRQTNPVRTLILDFKPPEPQAIHCCYLGHPVCGSPGRLKLPQSPRPGQQLAAGAGGDASQSEQSEDILRALRNDGPGQPRTERPPRNPRGQRSVGWGLWSAHEGQRAGEASSQHPCVCRSSSPPACDLRAACGDSPQGLA